MPLASTRGWPRSKCFNTPYRQRPKACSERLALRLEPRVVRWWARLLALRPAHWGQPSAQSATV